MANSPRDGRGRRNTPGPMDAMGVYPKQKMVDITAKTDGSKSSGKKQQGRNGGEESQFPDMYKTDMKTPKKVCVFPD